MPRVIPATTIVDVTISDLEDIILTRTATGIEIEVYYEVKDDQGNVHHKGVLRRDMTAAQTSHLKEWVDAKVLPVINQQEGM